MKLNNFIITNEGYNVVNSAIINAKDITFKKIEVGDGVWNNSDIPDATELIHTVQESLISDVRVMDDKTVQCVANISNKDLSDNYTVREIGVFVEVDGDDVLYSIATAKEEFQMYIEHEVGAMQIDFRFYQKISTGNITILQSNDSYVLKETLEKSIYLENDIEEAVEEKTGFLRKFISNAWEKVYAYSHAKVCEYKKDANGNVTTVAEELDQLNSDLGNATTAISKCDLICTIEKLTNNVVKEFPAKWQDYYFISICYGNYGNIFNSILIPSYYLEATTESTRVIVNSNTDNACSIYKKDASTLYARTGNWVDSNGRIRIYGIMKK